MRPQVWLAVSATITYAFSPFQVIMISLMLFAFYVRKKRLFYTFVGIYFGVCIIYLLFVWTWIIIGYITVFENARWCKDDAYSLWVITIIMWIMLFLNNIIITCGFANIKFKYEDFGHVKCMNKKLNK